MRHFHLSSRGRLLPVVLWLIVALQLVAEGGALQEQADQPPVLGRFLQQLETPGPPLAACFSRDGSKLWVLGSREDELWCYDVDPEAREPLRLRPVDAGSPGDGRSFSGARGIAANARDGVTYLRGDGVLMSAFEREGALVRTVLSPRGPAASEQGLASFGAQVLFAGGESGAARLGSFSVGLDKSCAVGAGWWPALDDTGNAFIADVDFDTENGDLYLVDRDRARIVVHDADGIRLRHFGDWGPHPGFFSHPNAICVRGERVYVCDGGNHRVQVLDRRGEPLHQWGTHALRPGAGEGRLHYPAGLAVRRDERLAIVIEPIDERLQVFGPHPAGGSEEAPAPLLAGGKNTTHYGAAIAIGGKRLALTSPEDHQVLIHEFSEGTTPQLIARVGWLGTGYGLFVRPEDIALSSDGKRLAVSDPALHRISIFALGESTGGFDARLARLELTIETQRLAEEDSAWESAGAISPGPLCFVGDHLLVCDRLSDALLEFDADGQLLFALRDGEEPSRGRNARPIAIAVGPGEDRLPVQLLQSDGTTLRFSWPSDFVADAHGTALGKAAPIRLLESAEGGSLVPANTARFAGLCLDAQGDAVLVDAGDHCVWPLTSELRGSPGLGPREFRSPRGIACDDQGRFYIVDHGNHRVQVLGPDGKFLDAFGSRPYVELAKQAERKAPDDSRESEAEDRR